MEMVYGLRTKIVHDDDGRMHIGYGIEVLNGENAKVTVIEDVFLDMAKAVTFIALCNTIIHELIEESGSFLLCDKIVSDVLTITRIWPIESWMFMYEEIHIEDSRMVVAKVRKKRREVLKSINCCGMSSFA